MTPAPAASPSSYYRREASRACNSSEAGSSIQLERSGHPLMSADAFKIVKYLQFTDGVSLAAASASAAADPDADDAEGAVGDAPACPLCLSSRKQVALPQSLPPSPLFFLQC
jgi:hypothetical protein